MVPVYQSAIHRWTCRAICIKFCDAISSKLFGEEANERGITGVIGEQKLHYGRFIGDHNVICSPACCLNLLCHVTFHPVHLFKSDRCEIPLRWSHIQIYFPQHASTLSYHFLLFVLSNFSSIPVLYLLLYFKFLSQKL